MILDNMMRPEISRLYEKMMRSSNHEFRFVGGCVRDSLLGVEPKDIDLCTTAIPEELAQMAVDAGFHVVLTGEKHGTITIVVDGFPIEVTTLRVDTETDGRHAKVRWTTSFEEDASRRDLTFNAMSVDFSGNLYDYFGGKADLTDNVVRFVGDATLRITEDYLRILRYFRFAARLDSNFDEETLDVISQPNILEGLKTISKERVWQEMSKLFTYKSRYRVVSEMFFRDVAQAINLLSRPVALLNRACDPVAALSTYFTNVSDAEALADNWKLSTAERNKLSWLVSVRDTDLTAKFIEDALVLDKQRDWVVSFSHLKSSRTSHADRCIISHAETFVIPTFPLGGKDLLLAGVKPGVKMGNMLSQFKYEWIASRFQLTKEEMLARIK